MEHFVGQHPVVGQSVELDVQRLEAAGLRLPNSAIDTFELATLLLPGLRTYDLSTVASVLGVSKEQVRHRALPDARLSMKVFLALVERINSLSLQPLAEINRLSAELDWPLRPIFLDAQRQRLAGANVLDLGKAGQDEAGGLIGSLIAKSPAREPLKPSETRRLVAIQKLTDSLRLGGQVAHSLNGYEERPEQIEMLRAIAETFNSGGHLLVEAGTGTGKSLAYLLPAIELAVNNDRRVVISTNTINLQDQLSTKDVPTLQAAAQRPFRYTVLKGRSNYLCIRRWLSLLRSDGLSPDERRLLIKTLLWLPDTRTGDRAELRLARGEAEAWARVSAAEEACTPLRCSYHRAGVCFLARARRLAEASHIVVVNHALLLSDLATSSRVLPEYQHLVIDEAHHLEDEATQRLGWSLGQRDLATDYARLLDPESGASASLIPRVLGYLRRQKTLGSELGRLDTLSASLVASVRGLRERTRTLFDLLEAFADDHGSRAEGGSFLARITDALRAQPAWSEIEIACASWQEALDGLLGHLATLGGLLERPDRRDEAWEELSAELGFQSANLDQTAAKLCRALMERDPTAIVWLSSARGHETRVSLAPLNVADALRQALFDEKESVVLTSATLTSGKQFDYIRGRLGLEDCSELVVGSPFDYGTAVLVYLPVDMPEPNQPGYQAAVERALGSVVDALQGRTLALFTSYNQLKSTYQALKDPLEKRGITLLGQRMDGASRERLLEHFRQGERVALLGTTSFWEGVDVVGSALSCLVIARLPFSVPSDPVFQARCEQFDEPFSEFAVPQAVLRLRQGFGRLIRSRSDRGIVVILDSRLTRRSYGGTFLASLPDCTVRRGPASSLAEAARDWLAPATVGA